ncbi:TRAFs-binding domain-containing protein [Sulfurovum sp. ST-21]|uniref:Uncharacterized protein n=1 Tax=Sulfurovum indicum TaxID=2779528 RepID=A0A7M1S178_9BACT|nr:TRAFs-binding domain-containing protein [Sulfurovum indicum]QOR61223.1 hypothetical protein IMZ28_07115 [Sulfurovum indicum]
MTDIQKFQCMVSKYRDKYEHYEIFAEKIGASRAAVNNWENGAGNKLQTKNRTKICEGFGLRYDVWTEHYYTEQEFMKHLDTYLLDQDTPVWEEKEKVFFDDIIKMSPAEEEQIKILDTQDPVSLPGNIEGYSPDFMMALIRLLKDNNQIEDALRITDVLLASNTLYKAKHYNLIQHLKAVLLSSERVRDWDGALDILNILYFSAGYHMEEPEVLTLIASNYKRKALYSEKGTLNPPDVRYIDMDLLGKAQASYRESYGLKKEERYYDAINIAYLIGIINALETDSEQTDTRSEIKALYEEVHKSGWKTNEDDWWEVATEIEFLVLMDKMHDAIGKLNDYLDWNEKSLKKFDMGTTIRQLELYIHFTGDNSAKEFLDYMKECQEAIGTNSEGE